MGFYHSQDELMWSDNESMWSDNECESCVEQYDSDNDSVYTDDDIPETPRSFIPERQKTSPVVRYMQLGSIASGCDTYAEARAKYDKEAMEIRRQMELKRQEEEKEQARKDKEFMDSLPKFSKKYLERMKREEAERKEQAAALKKQQRAERANKKLKFSHRRNGGGKRGGRSRIRDSTVKTPTPTALPVVIAKPAVEPVAPKCTDSNIVFVSNDKTPPEQKWQKVVKKTKKTKKTDVSPTKSEASTSTTSSASGKSVLCKNGSDCRFGDKCRYAHTLEELSENPCKYQDKCVHIKIVNCNVFNSDTSSTMCFRTHCGETKADMVKRCTVIKTTETVNTQDSVAPSLSSVKLVMPKQTMSWKVPTGPVTSVSLRNVMSQQSQPTPSSPPRVIPCPPPAQPPSMPTPPPAQPPSTPPIVRPLTPTRPSNHKTNVCKSVINGTVCPYGSKCNFAHTPDELRCIPCDFKSNCRNVLLQNGVHFNNGPHVCCRQHKGETEENVKKRCFNPPKRVLPHVIPTPPPATRTTKTMFCRSVFDGTTCPYGSKCTYAHNSSEITPRPCNYGNRCIHICVGSTGAFNKQGSKLCQHIHPCESSSTYALRVIGKD